MAAAGRRRFRRSTLFTHRTTAPPRRRRLVTGTLVAIASVSVALGCADPAAERGAPSPASPPGAAATPPPAAPDRDHRPFRNVLLVTIDTWRWDAAGFAGNRAASTPTLDRLAAGGLRFERAHAHNVLTLPSHANILTGRPPFDHGVRDNAGFFLRPEQVTLAERLATAGFATGAVVGAFPVDSGYGLDQGFALYDDSFPRGDGSTLTMAERDGSEVVDLGLDWWRDNASTPRFLWLHLYDPHTPYQPSNEGLRAAGGDRYLAEVADVDRDLERILGPLLDGSDPAADDTLVVVTADHGEALGDHGEASHGLFAYEATLRVPLLLWGGGLEPEISDEPAQHLDLVPTVLDALGLEAVDDLPGRSLLRRFSRPDLEVYFEALNGTLLRGWAPLRGIVRSAWNGEDWSARKYIELPIPEFYDLDRDPGELDNLLPGAEAAAETLAAALPTESRWPPEAGSVSEEERRALEGLGYLASGGPANLPSTFTAADDPKNLIGLDQKLHRFIDLYQTGRLEDATALAREMIEERPQMGVAHYHLAQVLLERGLHREALRVLSNAYRTGATTPALVRQLGLTLAEAGRPEEAISILEPLVDSGDLETLLTYAQALTEAGRRREAREVLDRVQERDDDNARIWEIRAFASVGDGDWPRAQREARRAMELDPSLPLPLNYLGVALYNIGQREPALDAWRRSLELQPEDHDVLYNFAIVSLEAGRIEEGGRALRRFVAEAPADRYAADLQRAREILERLP